MLKYLNTQMVFQEFPGETALAINLTGCPNRCPGCHSPQLQEDIGTPLTPEELDRLIGPLVDTDSITCIGFMGGDVDHRELRRLLEYGKEHYPGLRWGWYSGFNVWSDEMIAGFDYVKLGSYKEALGDLTSPTTNQIMLKYIHCVDRWLDITPYFRIRDKKYRNMVDEFEWAITTAHNTSDASYDELFERFRANLINYGNKISQTLR